MLTKQDLQGGKMWGNKLLIGQNWYLEKLFRIWKETVTASTPKHENNAKYFATLK